MNLIVGFEQEESVTGKYYELNGYSRDMMKVLLGERSIKKKFHNSYLQLIC
jgi:hypothetical protein